MKSAEIKEILKGNFSNSSDRVFWENKLAEVLRKENNAKENNRYFDKMVKYDR